QSLLAFWPLNWRADFYAGHSNLLCLRLNGCLPGGLQEGKRRAEISLPGGPCRVRAAGAGATIAHCPEGGRKRRKSKLFAVRATRQGPIWVSIAADQPGCVRISAPAAAPHIDVNSPFSTS